jgi:hypothetical protein
VAASDFLESFTQVGKQTFAAHSQNAGGRLSRRDLEIEAGAPAELENVEVLVDQDSRRRKAFEEQAIHFALPVR